MSPFDNLCHRLRALTFGGLLLLSAGAWAASGAADAGSPWGQVPAYKLGQDRKPLQALEDLIRATQEPAARRGLERQLIAVLNAGATPDAKHWICRQLWFLGTDESVPSLARLLADPQCVEMACYALGRNPSPASTQALIRGIPEAQGLGRVAIINALAGRTSPEACGAFERHAADQESVVAEAAIRALGMTGTPKSAASLARLAAGSTAARLPVVRDAQLRCAQLMNTAGNRSAAAAIYKELLAPTLPPHIRRGALLGLVSANPATAFKTAAKWLQTDEPVARAAAVAAFRTGNPGMAARNLVPLLQAATSETILEAIRILGDLHEPSAVPGLLRAMRHPQADVRIAATRTAGMMANDKVIEALLQLATSVEIPAVERDAALAGLRASRGARIDPQLVAGLASAQAQVRPGLIALLADRGATSALPALLNEAAAGDPAGRRAAVRAIARLGDPSQAPALIKLVGSLTDDSLRGDFEQTIIEVCRRALATDRWAEPVLAGFTPQTPPAGRSSLVRVLGGLGGRASLDRISAALQDPDQGVQESAFRELTNWPTPDALGLLRTMFKTASQPIRRTLALRGYARLLSIDAERPAPQRMQDYQDLMRDAGNADERKLVLAGLSELAQPGAIDIALPCLADEATRSEASLALTRIALAVAGAQPEAARRALEKVADAPIDAATREKAQKALLQLDAQSSWLTSWQLSGPYSQDGKNHAALFDIVFPPEESGAQDVKWRDLPAGTDPARPFVVDVLRVLGGEQRVAYVRTFLQSPRAQEAILELGSDDGAKVWLNGTVVHANNIARPLVPDADKATVTLREGNNVLLIKLTQNNLGWEFCARLHRPDGRRVDGLRQSPTP